MNQLPQPPALIKIKSDFSQGIDTRNPLHAKAYLKAASFFLSGWPQEWNAETLALALVDEENENQKQVKLWKPMEENAANEDCDPYLFTDEQICSLAEEFVNFLDENK